MQVIEYLQPNVVMFDKYYKAQAMLFDESLILYVWAFF
jgi:hypothetical protein